MCNSTSRRQGPCDKIKSLQRSFKLPLPVSVYVELLAAQRVQTAYKNTFVSLFVFGFNMVKLSAELIEQAAQYTNPVRDRELDLRGLFGFSSACPCVETARCAFVRADRGNALWFIHWRPHWFIPSCICAEKNYVSSRPGLIAILSKHHSVQFVKRRRFSRDISSFPTRPLLRVNKTDSSPELVVIPVRPRSLKGLLLLGVFFREFSKYQKHTKQRMFWFSNLLTGQKKEEKKKPSKNKYFCP